MFLVYGVHVARLLGLPEQPRSKIPLLPQLPARYRPLFVEGCGDVLRDLAPIRLNGTIVPIGAANSVRPQILGSFNYRAVLQEGALDASAQVRVLSGTFMPASEQRAIPPR